jgi:hypothetical protein
MYLPSGDHCGERACPDRVSGSSRPSSLSRSIGRCESGYAANPGELVAMTAAEPSGDNFAPWTSVAFMNSSTSMDEQSLSPDERAATGAEGDDAGRRRSSSCTAEGMPGWRRPVHAKDDLGNGGAGFVLGVPRLGIPQIEMSDAAYGVRMSAQNGRYSTALPANVAAAASWDPEAACDYGALIGRELRAQGYNMTLGGGVNLTREPRNGRTFEYQGEDPLLAGTLVGNRIKCEQAQHVIGDIKHYVMNDQENGRDEVDAIISKRAMRESDMLAFQIGIGIGKPGCGDVLLQRHQRRLRLPEQIHADRCAQEGLAVQRLRGLRLGWNPQHGQGVGRGTGQ